MDFEKMIISAFIDGNWQAFVAHCAEYDIDPEDVQKALAEEE